MTRDEKYLQELKELRQDFIEKLDQFQDHHLPSAFQKYMQAVLLADQALGIFLETEDPEALILFRDLKERIPAAKSSWQKEAG